MGPFLILINTKLNKMKFINIAFVISLIILLEGCLYEPPPVYYSFTIENKSDSVLVVKSLTIEDSYEHIDTLRKNENYNIEIIKMQCYDDFYKDSLIKVFFNTLELYSLNKKIKINPYLRKNWKESLRLEGRNCKKGTAAYTLSIASKDVL